VEEVDTADGGHRQEDGDVGHDDGPRDEYTRRHRAEAAPKLLCIAGPSLPHCMLWIGHLYSLSQSAGKSPRDAAISIIQLGEIRDDIERRVVEMLMTHGWLRMS
jgi:hypothetical protein